MPHVWVTGAQGWEVVAEVVNERSGEVVDTDGVRRQVDMQTAKPVPAALIAGVEDMTKLSDLHDGALLYNLRGRYRKDEIYTYTGSILVSINPYRLLPIYNLECVRKYQAAALGDLPPHIFAIAKDAHTQLVSKERSQCVCISGESGAGKTECTKLILKFLAASSKNQSTVSERIIETSPILESFGNAKTVRNDNSSRFGKYLELQFTKAGSISGAIIYDYLLEKSRVVYQGLGERNYHIFYELCSGIKSADERRELALGDATSYKYLTQGECVKIDNKQDAEDWFLSTRAMEVIGFATAEITDMKRLLAAILHLGNISFAEVELPGGLSGSAPTDVREAARLFGVDQVKFQEAIVSRSSFARGEEFVTPLKPNEAADLRDALGKAAYARLFSWIVHRINRVINESGATELTFGVLDIFGFENFDFNSFEQLCINYANENLQLYFNDRIFKIEQSEYLKEGLDWKSMSYVDNQPCLDVISRKPNGILSLLDEECAFPKGTDQTFLEKLKNGIKDATYFKTPKQQSDFFTVVHYAGAVNYNITGFLERNRDTLQENIVAVMLKSSSKLVAELFGYYAPEASGTAGKNAKGATTTASGGAARRRTSGKQFHESLTQLIARMNACNSFFVRCIKPNANKRPNEFQDQMVMEQLRYSGMMETIRIRKACFPVRLEFAYMDFRYRALKKSTTAASDPKAACLELLRRLAPLIPTDTYQVGISKVFLRESAERILEQERFKATFRLASVLQAWVRRFLAQRRYAQRRVDVAKQHEDDVIVEQAFKDLPLNEEEIKHGVAMPAMQRVLLKIRKGERERVDLPHGKYSMIDYARAHFQLTSMGSPPNTKSLSRPATRSLSGGIIATLSRRKKERPQLPDESNTHISLVELAELTQYSPVPLKRPLLKEPEEPPESAGAQLSYNVLGLQISELILRIMGDLPNERNQEHTYLEQIHQLLFLCVQNPPIRDEAFCQTVRQLNKNNSPVPESTTRGWVLFMMLTIFVKPSATLFPFLRHFAHGSYNRHPKKHLPIAALVEQQLLRTFRCGCRKLLPDLNELTGLSRGEYLTKLQVFIPGDTVIETEVNTLTTTADLVADICELMGASDPLEYGLFICTGPEANMPLQLHDYIADAIFAMERRRLPHRIYFKKMLWYSPVNLEKPLHVQLLQEQAMTDYSNGDLMSTDDITWTNEDIALLAAIEFLLSPDADIGIDNIDEILLVETLPYQCRYMLSTTAWYKLVKTLVGDLEGIGVDDLRKLYVEKIIALFPMYGANFFYISECSDPRIYKDCLLAVDRNGLYFLDVVTKCVIFSYSFNELMSTRRLGSYQSERHFVDLKVGNLVDQKVVRCETAQALLVTTVITRYIQKHVQAMLKANR